MWHLPFYTIFGSCLGVNCVETHKAYSMHMYKYSIYCITVSCMNSWLWDLENVEFSNTSGLTVFHFLNKRIIFLRVAVSYQVNCVFSWNVY